MTSVFRGSTPIAGSFCRPWLAEHAFSTASVYVEDGLTSLKSATYPPFVPSSLVSRWSPGEAIATLATSTAAMPTSVERSIKRRRFPIAPPRQWSDILEQSKQRGRTRRRGRTKGGCEWTESLGWGTARDGRTLPTERRDPMVTTLPLVGAFRAEGSAVPAVR